MRAIKDEGYTTPTPIQAQAIPHVLAGRDLIGLAQTGTGKTAAFALPTLQYLVENATHAHGKKGRRPIKVLVLAPTRELAAQIDDSFAAYGRYTRIDHMTIFGGVSQKPQAEKLRRGVDVVVATPGRLLDLMEQGLVNLDHIKVLVLDEADRMLDMGFMPSIRRIIGKLPVQRQTLLFSATMPPDIQALTRSIQTDPVEVAVTPESTTVDAISQQLYFVEKGDKFNLLRHLLDEHNMHRTLVFTRTKHSANRLCQRLEKSRIRSAAIHGNKSQRARETALADFKAGRTQVLVATDIAARGIDVDDVSHVVNFDLPNETESYVHRIGRTGRAGAVGQALSFCAVDERDYLIDIERLIQMHIPVDANHPYASPEGVPEPTDLRSKRRPARRKPSNGSQGRKPSGDKPRHGGANKPQRSGGAKDGQHSSAANSSASNRRRNSTQKRKPTPQA